MRKSISPLVYVEHLPSKVATHINREIKAGRLISGDKLPPEKELAESLGVSRNVLREAISQLRADGVIHARQGVGAFVMSPEDSKVIRLDPQDLNNRRDLAQLFELRAVLETEAAALAAERVTDENITRLRQALERMEGAERQRDGSIEADLDFHREIARTTGNDYISTFVNYIALQIRQSIYTARQRGPIEDMVGSTVAEHIDVFQALEAKDPKWARRAMRVHIIGAADRVGAPISNLQKE